MNVTEARGARAVGTGCLQDVWPGHAGRASDFMLTLQGDRMHIASPLMGMVPLFPIKAVSTI